MEIFNISGKGGRTLCGRTLHFIGGLDNHLETKLYYLIFISLSGYLYLPNNLKEIKDHIWADMKSWKIFFQLIVTVFKEKLNL